MLWFSATGAFSFLILLLYLYVECVDPLMVKFPPNPNFSLSQCVYGVMWEQKNTCPVLMFQACPSFIFSLSFSVEFLLSC